MFLRAWCDLRVHCGASVSVHSVTRRIRPSRLQIQTHTAKYEIPLITLCARSQGKPIAKRMSDTVNRNTLNAKYATATTASKATFLAIPRPHSHIKGIVPKNTSTKVHAFS